MSESGNDGARSRDVEVERLRERIRELEEENANLRGRSGSKSRGVVRRGLLWLLGGIKRLYLGQDVLGAGERLANEYRRYQADERLSPIPEMIEFWSIVANRFVRVRLVGIIVTLVFTLFGSAGIIFGVMHYSELRKQNDLIARQVSFQAEQEYRSRRTNLMATLYDERSSAEGVSRSHRSSLRSRTEATREFIEFEREKDRVPNLSEVSLRNAEFGQVDFSGVKLRKAQLNGVNFVGAALRDVNFTLADLTKAKLTRTDLSNANMRGATLNEADFTGAKCVGTNFQQAKSEEWVNFFEADLRGANFLSAGLAGSRIHEVQLEGATLTEADFSNSDLKSVDFKDCIWGDTNLTGAHIEGVTGLDIPKLLEGAIWDGSTHWPMELGLPEVNPPK